MSDQTTDIDVMAVNLLQRERIAELEAEAKVFRPAVERCAELEAENAKLREALKAIIEIDNDNETAVVLDSLDSLVWMYTHAELTKKEKKAYRTVIKMYMNHDDFKQRFNRRSVYK